MPFKIPILIWQLAAIILTLLIAILSLMPKTNLSSVDIAFVDKLAHGVAYFTLTITWLLAILSKKKLNNKKQYFYISSVIISYGIIIELIQGIWLPFRFFDIFDIFANILGTLTAVLMYQIVLSL